ncbi:unnamed protein product [Candidula unifasciata]|uniref:CABIT domain-containing protein n=1 Tax=Candidula unifasciata TaxID=100452 RepID=A0A8S3YRV2_9EUPU|nr:unnamed protein product [Candidula unifasciata]
MAVTSDSYNIQDVCSQISTSFASTPCNISELLWEDKVRSLRDLVTTYRLPLVVKLKSGDINTYIVDNISGSSVNNETKLTGNGQVASNNACDTSATDKSSPANDLTSSSFESKNTPVPSSGQADVILQIHETRRRKIIQTRKMTWEKRQNDYVVSGEQVEIPASFKGWFEVVPDDGRPVEYFDTIGGIASIKPRRFLVRTSIVGYQLSTEETGSSCWMPYEIKTGDVLTTGIIYTDTKKARSPTNRNILKRFLKQSKSKKEQDLKYLQCFDSNGWEIMIPFIMSGVFSPVGDSTVANFDALYELQDLIIAFGLPVNTQLIHANNKDGFHCPRGVMRLYGTREEELAVVSKIGPDGILFRNFNSCEKFEVSLDHMLFSRGVVKRKPVIKSKLVEGISNHYGKTTNKFRSEDSGIKDKDYVTAKLMENFRIRSTNDKQFIEPSIDKDTYMSISSMNKTVPTHEDKTTLNKDDHEVTLVSNDSSLSTVFSDSNNQSGLTDQSSRQTSNQLNSVDQNSKNEVELPERVPKKLKKSRSTSILDKLSVRRVKKERAKLKELRGDDVFSKRITRSELSYQEFFNGLDNEEEKAKKTEAPKPDQDDDKGAKNGGTYQGYSSGSTAVCHTSTPNTLSKASFKVVSDTAKSIQREANIQKRGLPPIPIEAQTYAQTDSPNQNVSMESLYEHLPPAPKPPHYRRASDSALLDDKCNDSSADSEENAEDDYMVPLQIQQESRYTKRSDVNVLHKQLELTKDSVRSRRARKSRSELPPEFVSRGYCYDQSRSLDTDDMFNLAYTSTKYGESHPLYNLVGPSAGNSSQIYGTYKLPSRRSDLSGNTGNFGHHFEAGLDLEAANSKRGLPQSSGFSKHANPHRKAAVRSHSLRKAATNENTLLNQGGSFHGFREGNLLPTFYDFPNGCIQQAHSQSAYLENPHRQLLTSRSIDAAIMSQHLQQYQQQLNCYARDYGVNYAGSEPTFCQNNRAISLSGISDGLFKQGDDSAISMCSRGEAGYPNESEYSYKEQIRQEEDTWTPPEKLEGLTVQEVSKSLRYIGMKDRIILRFSNEQIDGSMLCSLDKKLLIGGFPELNALEVKKILDFVQGWRPKKN